MLIGPDLSGPLARSPNREILDCSAAWTPGAGPGHLLSTQVTGVVRRMLADTPDHGGRSERVRTEPVSRQQTTKDVLARRAT